MIEQLELTNFKNFRAATLPLGKFTVIVGTNASGKSNLRDAFRFVHGISRGYSLAEIIGEKWGSGGELRWVGIRGGVREIAFNGQSEIQLSAVFSTSSSRTAQRTATYKISVDIRPTSAEASANKLPYIVEESYKSGDVLGFDAAVMPDDERKLLSTFSTNEGGLKQYLQPATHPVIGAEARLLSIEPESSQLCLAIMQLAQDVDAPRQIMSIFRKNTSGMRFFDLDPYALRIPSMPGQIVLGDRGENLSSVLLAICEDAALKAAVLEWVRQLTPLDVIDFEFEPDAAGRVLVKLVEGNGQKTSALSASDGTLRFLAMLAALYGPNAAGFYFFDEIETGIHPTRLHLLIQLIEQRVSRGDVQVVATTHSPQLLGLLNDESREAAVLTYRLEGHPEGRIKRIMDLPHVKDVLREDSLLRLHESGWFEDSVEFLEGGQHPQ